MNTIFNNKLRLFILFIMVSLQISAQNIRSYPNNEYVAFIDNPIPFKYEKEGLKWQWAACIQFVLNTKNVSITQKEIIKENRTLRTNNISYKKVVTDLYGWQINNQALKAKIDTLIPETIKHNLAFNKPIIILFKNEITDLRPCILTAFHYKELEGKITPEKVVIRDPKKNEEDSRVEILWLDFINKSIFNIIIITF